MQIIENTVDFHFSNTAVTLGKFDGIHLGHKKILHEIRKAKEEGLTTVVFTFSVQPSFLISGEKESLLLTSDEKIQLYKEQDVDILIIYPVTESFFSMEPEEFVKKILVEKLGMKLMIGGNDLRFGKDRRGDVKLAKQLGEAYGFRLKAIEKEPLDDKIISSSEIRHNILSGEMEKAGSALGYPYFFSGEICHGRALGRTIGIPTINQKIDERKIIPPYGVYASETVIEDETYRSITNIGRKPTIESGLPVSVETHILDFDKDVYGKHAVVRLLHFMRPEQRFPGVEALKTQMQKDIEQRRRNVR